jgi:transcriptional regulator with PAS, ATPase and Fis domain
MEKIVSQHSWIKEFPGAIIVCNPQGIILEMNDQAIKTFQDDGGEKLIGTSLLDCHPEPSRSKVKQMLDTKRPNIYTIEKRGVKKLIYQMPWHTKGKYSGFVELSLEIPFEIPHFIREG